MRTTLLAVLLVASVVIVGCSRSGDFGGFLVQQVTKCGGRTNANATLPKLDARWTVKRDKNGFRATVTGTTFAGVDTFMQQAFGRPRMSGDGAGSATGQPHREWAARDIGVVIQLMGRPDGADIICVRAMSGTGEMFREMEKPWWRKLW